MVLLTFAGWNQIHGSLPSLLPRRLAVTWTSRFPSNRKQVVTESKRFVDRMSTLVAELRRRWLPGRGLAAPLAVMCVYFGVILGREWRPGFAGTGVFFVYVLSIPFTLLVLLGLANWAMIGAIAAHRRGGVVRSSNAGRAARD